MSAPITCWICQSAHVALQRRGAAGTSLAPEHFRITAKDYGITGDIYRCGECGFLFCPTIAHVLDQYEKMSDPAYEDTRAQRALQAEKILDVVQKYKPGGQLIDIGAGSGILVEQSLRRGYTAVGIEPSRALSQSARDRGLDVVTGTLPNSEFNHRFDIATLIDVIEHVESPLQLVRETVQCMNADGICVIVTPDVASFAARVMGAKWWHYRLAHVSYFNIDTLQRLLSASGLEVVSARRPGWYFPANYLAERLQQYLPKIMRIKIPAALERVTVPLNLFDSLLVVAKRSHSPSPRPAIN